MRKLLLHVYVGRYTHMCRPVMQTVCQGCETITAHEAELLKSIGTMGWAA